MVDKEPLCIVDAQFAASKSLFIYLLILFI